MNYNKRIPSREYELIERLQSLLPSVNRSRYEMTIGDDAAVRINADGERLIVTADVSVENVHFSLDTMGMDEIGYRAMVSNLSDCAAMGAVPDSAVVQLVFPKDRADVNGSIEEIYRGFARACERWNFPIVGGDLSGGAAWTIGITLIGSVEPDSRHVLRKGIKDGDELWVTGVPGMSAAGLACLKKWGRANVPPKYQNLVNAHIAPIPRIDEGLKFAQCKHVHAMMDLSDGLSKDVGTLCYDNDLGFTFDSDLSPSHEMKMLSEELNVDWRDWYYHGGEEYELLVAGECEIENMIRLGRFTSEYRGMFVGDSELSSRSWDHCN